MTMYVSTKLCAAVSSEEEMENEVLPKEKELLFTYISVSASYSGVMRNAA
jgi:hypothetical protein